MQLARYKNKTFGRPLKVEPLQVQKREIPLFGSICQPCIRNGDRFSE